MKILKLVLKNFAAVKNAMSSNCVTIDFSNAVNKICLLIGHNGSGKTTILSMLHPFADVGNLDIRNGNNLILENKEGYKEIQILKNNDLYVIKHFYTPHKDKNHSVKSYISKNDVELNVNGNVTSFKEYVREELQIEPDYLKLIRLGSNVTSLIDLSATERKNFMSKIMDEIGIILEYYKSVNQKSRQLEEMISHTVDKLNRLNIIDRSDYEKEIRDLEVLIIRLNDEYLNLSNRKAVLLNTIDNIDDVTNIRENVSNITKKYNKMNSIMEKKNDIESFDISFYEKKIKDLEKIIMASESEYDANIILIQNSLEHLNTLSEELRSYKITLNKEEEHDKECERMNANLNTMRLKLREYESILGDFIAPCSKNDLNNFIVFLKNSQNILRTTYEFGKPVIKRVVDLMIKKKNVINYINRHLLDLDDKRDDKSSLFIATLASRFLFDDEAVLKCPNECQAKLLYNQIKNMLENSNVEDNNEDAQFYHDMEFAYSNIISILPKFSDYREIIERLPEDIKKDFDINTILSNIGKMDFIFNEKKMNELISMTTEYENYNELLISYNREEEILSKFEGIGDLKAVKNIIEKTVENIEELENKINDYKERNSSLLETKKDAERSLESYLEIKETLEKFDDVKMQYERLLNDYELYKSTKEEIDNLEINITRTKINIDNETDKMKTMSLNIGQYVILSQDLEKMNKVYDDLTFVKKSLSSKDGIPLHFISTYLNDTEEVTNELLDIAYDGKIFIDKFDITPTEFSIPFYNKGVRLPDVKYSSQGELSFLSIALSFALSSKALRKYNIMLLDEIDGPLDTVNREKFIKILENQIDRIDSEQNFLITHNSMFSSYPVDIIDLSFKKDKTDYPLANYIDVIRE